jgi:uncharacterized Zn-finger protein
VLWLSSNHPKDPKQEMIERVKSMVFLCMYCDNRYPISLSLIEDASQGSRLHVRGFFICPDCKNKFMINIEDLGKVGQV